MSSDTIIPPINEAPSPTTLAEREAVCDEMGGSPDRGKLYAALVKAQAKAQGVAKDSRNDFHKYRYASAEDVISEAREALTSAGLALMTVGWRFEPLPLREAKNDDGSTFMAPMRAIGSLAVGRMKVRYRLVHESGEWLDVLMSTPVLPEKGRPDDKAEATALTYNLGYSLRNLLCLPRVEEGTDAHGRADGPQPPPKASVDLFEAYKRQIGESKTPKDLAELSAQIAGAGFGDAELKTLRELHAARKKEIAAPSSPRGGAS